MRKGLPVFFLAMLISLNFSFGQEKEVSKKAVKFFEKALGHYRLGELGESELALDRALKEDTALCDAWILAGDLYYDSQRLEESVEAYRKALGCGPDKPMIVRELLAQTLFQAQRYGEAVLEYNILLDSDDVHPELKRKLLQKGEIASFRQSLMDHPVSYTPKNLGPAINTPYEEYVNAVGAETDQLVFTRKVPISNDRMQREFEEDFFRSFLSDTGWAEAQRFAFIPSAFGDAGGLCMSADGRMLFFTACFRLDSEGSCDLYYSETVGNEWSVPKNMGQEVNSDNWDAQPSISPDGTTLYFASNREGSIGSSDIWMTERLNNGGWTKPVNLGAPVNTAEAEMAPFIHFDNNTFYFSSEGHPGMGGHDLFVTRRGQAGWEDPVNLGYPVNTLSDELVIVVSPDAAEAFISADLPGGKGGYDIYSFTLPEESRPAAVTYLKGKVFDKNTLEPLRADFGLYDLETDSLIMHSVSSDEDGSFLVCLPLGAQYALHVSCKGYLFFSDHFELQEAHGQGDPYLRDIPMEPLAAGKSVILRNIFYETDRYELREESRTELNKLVEFLNTNPGVHIEISGHTDNVGTEAYNKDLSAKRAGEVYNYMVDQGIPSDRLTFNGYGFSQPIASNETEEGRAANRRTEFKILRVDKLSR